ncbi:MAG: endonuclease/exonuclease/phosphatase family protein [Archangium sp.]|nr:endonuclease/exonuclease/phosphatase family protein [Archangium sp.]
MFRVLAAVVLLLALTRCAHATRTAREAPRGVPQVRVVTYNLNYGLAGDEDTLAAIAATDADLVFLEETSPDWERVIRPSLSRTWPHQAYLHAPAAGGMAVLSKRAFVVKEVLPNPRGWFAAMRVITQTPIGPVQALVVHLHPPVTDDGDWVRGYLSTSPRRRAELEAWLPSLEPGIPTLVAGDFNEGTSGEAARLLEARGLRTVLPEFHPAAKTWRWPVGPLLLSAQLDHVAYDAQLEPLDARVVPRGRSDHLPVVADFIRAARGALRPPMPSGSSLSVSVR